jgi:hypothetical protein
MRDARLQTMSAQWIWPAGWKGAWPLAFFDRQAYPDRQALMACWPEPPLSHGHLPLNQNTLCCLC